MRYLSPEERKGNKEVHEYLGEFVSQSIKHNFPLQTLIKHVPEKNAVILDAGSASGAFLRQLGEEGYKNLYGLDLERYISEDVRVKDFKTADFNTDKIPFADNMFDAVTAWCVLAHLENPHHFLREINRILKPGGVFIATVPNTNSNSEKLNFYRKGEFIAYKPHNDHIAIWTPSLVQKTTARYFDIIDTCYLLKNKLFRGIGGGIRKTILKYSPKFERRWGSKTAYILKKKLS